MMKAKYMQCILTLKLRLHYDCVLTDMSDEDFINEVMEEVWDCSSKYYEVDDWTLLRSDFEFNDDDCISDIDSVISFSLTLVDSSRVLDVVDMFSLFVMEATGADEVEPLDWELVSPRARYE